MALIVAKRRMPDCAATDELLLGKPAGKKRCGLDTFDPRQLISIPDSPAEKLRVIFPGADDSVIISWL